MKYPLCRVGGAVARTLFQLVYPLDVFVDQSLYEISTECRLKFLNLTGQTGVGDADAITGDRVHPFRPPGEQRGEVQTRTFTVLFTSSTHNVQPYPVRVQKGCCGFI